MKEGIVTHIQRMSVHDGPGIRTTIFLKGCNMRCKWCHNPETFTKQPQLQFFSEKCIRCEDCKLICRQGARDEIYPDWDKCIHCGNCAVRCCSGASNLVGIKMNVEDVFEEILEDIDFYRESNGGITISGGEPLLQAGFCKAIMEESKKHNIHTALESNASVSWSIISSIVKYVDLFLIDLKIWDDNKHKKYTGISNKKIKQNIRKLDEVHKNYIVRTPLIRGVNASFSEIRKISAYISSLSNCQDYQLIPYHKLGVSKYECLGYNFELQGVEPLKAGYYRKLENFATKIFQDGNQI